MTMGLPRVFRLNSVLALAQKVGKPKNYLFWFPEQKTHILTAYEYAIGIDVYLSVFRRC